MSAAGLITRRIEMAVLLAIGVLLTVATVDDLARQVRVDERIAVDQATWRAYTHHRTHLLNVYTGSVSTTDVACGPLVAGATQRFCLLLTGSAHGPRRTIAGGYRLPLNEANRFAFRYGCFGTPLRQGLCGAATAPAGP